MPNLNKVMLMGNLTRDVELRYTPNANMAVAKLGLAVNRKWRHRETNEMQEETTFVDCEAWGRQAETLNQYMSKGKPIFIEGRLKFDQWQDQDGNKRSKLLVVVENFQFIDSAGGGGGGGGARNSGEKTPVGSGAGGGGGSHQPVSEDDIPF